MARRMTRCLSSAFTLIELLVVIAIIAILAAMLLPALASAREKSRRSACMNNLNQMAKSIESYLADYGGYYPSYGPQDGYGRWFGMYGNEAIMTGAATQSAVGINGSYWPTATRAYNFNNGLFTDKNGQVIYGAVGTQGSGNSNYCHDYFQIPTWRMIGWSRPQGAAMPGTASRTAAGNYNMAPVGLGFLITGGYTGDVKSFYCPTADGSMPHHEFVGQGYQTNAVGATRQWKTVGGTDADAFSYGNYSGFSAGPSGLLTAAANYAYRNQPYFFAGTSENSNDRGRHFVPYAKPVIPTSHNLGMFKTPKFQSGRALMADGFGNGASRNANKTLTPADGTQIMASANRLLPECADGFYAHKEGYNVLYGDNSARWFGDPEQNLTWRITGQRLMFAGGLTYLEGNYRDYAGAPPEVPVRAYFNGSYPGDWCSPADEWQGRPRTPTENDFFAETGGVWFWHQFDQAAGMDVGTYPFAGNYASYLGVMRQ